jgi:hypothetical protein
MGVLDLLTWWQSMAALLLLLGEPFHLSLALDQIQMTLWAEAGRLPGYQQQAAQAALQKQMERKGAGSELQQRRGCQLSQGG